MPYLLDSNIFIQAKNLHYGCDFCPAFWDWLDAGNQSGTVFSIEKVRDELLGGDDELADWAKGRGTEFFVAPDNADLASLADASNWAARGGDLSSSLTKLPLTPSRRSRYRTRA